MGGGTREAFKEIASAVEAVCNSKATYADESLFQVALAEHLGNCKRELMMEFAPPRLLPRKPPTSAMAECAAKGKTLSPEGKDPCSGSRRKLDILWHSSHGAIPIELKARDR